MIIGLCIAAYIICIIAFCLWDSYIGMPVEWDPNGDNAAPLWLAAIFWPIALPIVSIIAFVDSLERIKNHRLEREMVLARRKKREEEQAKKLRVQAEQEYEETLEEVEKVIHHG